MSARRVLGLDLATVSGWAVLGEHEPKRWVPTAWGEFDCSPESKDEPEGARYARLAGHLPALFEFYGPFDAVAIEQTFSNRFRTAQILYGMVAIALVELERRETPYTFVASGTWQKYVAGRPIKKGENRKRVIRESLNGWETIEPGTTIRENAVDALGVAKWLVDNALVDPAPELAL